ncbi:aspartyl/asparaginyl beta-hydroxylase domain-containing protein [Hyphococcus sp.]|uniref:aspartyl/asparaginyl beta-hydroxylase domain-containing protein n=1 Tax=Hyphococcus sp. TaxID=2038636 RepID=UPI00207DA250|nr:MAG: hypothetical protein DHS20C04_26330 [Marinicaulis sp.]
MNHTSESSRGAKSAPRDWRKQAIINIGKKARRRIDSVIVKFSKLPVTPVFDNDDLPWANDLERNWRLIKDECAAVMAEREKIPPLADISPDHERIAHREEWKSFFLWGYGYRSDVNCAKCPHTTRLVETIPGLQTAMFSILSPGAHIPPHTGVTKAIFNCHLGLMIPAGLDQCWISIDDKKYNWNEGKIIAFDDTYRHEVRNLTDKERVVLLLQVKRPVRFPGNLAANAFFQAVRHSPFVSDVRRNLTKWEKS